jgi:hypothetical protein
MDVVASLVAHLQPPVAVHPRKRSFDGLIAKGKFCMTRHARLSLRRSWCRAEAAHSRNDGPANDPAYPLAGITQHGGVDETPVAGSPHVGKSPGRPGALGPGIPEHPAVERGSRTSVRSERER